MHETRQPARWAALALLALVGCGRTPTETGGEQVTSKELTNGPDHGVKEVSRPSHTRPGGRFETTLTLCNHGQEMNPLEVKLYLSADEQLTEPEDPLLTIFTVNGIWPGRCVRRTVELQAPYQEGLWRLGARIATPSGAPDTDPSNNLRFSAPFGIGYLPDFVVRSVEGPRNVRPNAYVQTRTTVCNEGTQPGSVDLALVLSADEVLSPPGPGTPSDDVVVTGQHVGLDAGQCLPLPLSGWLKAPTSSTPPPSGPATYFLGVVASQFSNPVEFDPTNNTAGYPLGWGQGPDFVITSVKGPANARAYEPLTAQVTVCNQGVDSGSVPLELYLSDAPLAPQPPAPGGPTTEVRVGSLQTPVWLVPEQCTTVPLQGRADWTSASPQPRTLWLGARVGNGASQDMRPENNTFPGNRLGLGDGQDLVITSVKGPPSVEPGSPFTAEVTVCNQGTGPSPGTLDRVSVWLSEDGFALEPTSTASVEEPTAGRVDPHAYLMPAQCITVPVPAQASVWPSFGNTEFFLRARVESNDPNRELRRDNDTHPGYRLGVGSGPDFVITALQAPPSVRRGDPLRTQVTVCNQGTGPGSTDGVVLLSQDEKLQAPSPYGNAPGDFVVGSFSTGPLSAGQCTTATVDGSASPSPPPSPGPGLLYHLGAVVNPQRSPFELRFQNNTSAARVLRIGDGADFVITSVTGPASAQPGQTLTAQVTVCNQGTQPASTDVDLFLSEDTHLRAPVFMPPYGGGYFEEEDSRVGRISLPTLAPGQCATHPLTGSAQPPGPGPQGGRVYYLGAVVNAQGNTPELDLDNNTYAREQISVGAGADFVITSVTGPANVRWGEYLTAQVTVCNQGTQPASAPLMLVLSQDERIQVPATPWEPQSDFIVASTGTGPLVPGQCTTLPLTGSLSPSGLGYQRTYHLGAAVNPYQDSPELRGDNNTHAGYVLGVGDDPDFIFTSMTNPGFVQQGALLSTQVRVCNQGTRLGEAQVRVLLSEDARFRAHDAQGRPEDALVAETTTGPLPPGACTTLNLSAPAWPPPTSGPRSFPAAFHLGAVVELPSWGNELQTDNNTWDAGPLYVF
jgi:large repetitive protein